MNLQSTVIAIGALSALTSIVSGNVSATTTSANASAFVSGTTVTQSFTAGAEGTQASANQVIPSVIGAAFVSAQASSFPGALRTVGVARTDGSPGGFQAQASSSWTDSFVIAAPGYNSSMTGLFSGAVQVNGGLLVDFSGRTYSGAQVYATVDIFPGTGYNGGRTVVTGSARRLVGIDIPGIDTGNYNFFLLFSNVPFTFNQRIDISLRLAIWADVNAIDAGATGRSEANYAHTMTWSGLNSVSDQGGTLLPTYSASSTGSGFNFANATPVPEPNTVVLMGLGLLCIAQRRRLLIHLMRWRLVPG